MVTETDQTNKSILQRMVEAGEAVPPGRQGMPRLLPELADLPSLSDIVIADRDKERKRC